MNGLVEQHGQRFAPAALLVELSKTGGTLAAYK